MTVDANRVSLLSCPFCGSAGKMIRPMGERVFNKDENGRAVPPYYGPEWFRVVCGGDDCHCTARAYADEAEAVAAWNRRSPSLSGGEVERYEPFANEDDGEFTGMKPWADGEWIKFSSHTAVIAAKDAEIERLTKERNEALLNAWCPDVCPVTQRPFFMWIDGEPTYGGPFDSYTIPTKDAEGEYVRRRYDHDEGGWKDWDEGLSIKIVDDSDWLGLEDRAEAAEARANAAVEALGRIAGIKYPSTDTHYALKATIDYGRDQASEALASLNGAKP